MNYLLLGPEEGEKNEWLKREKEKVLREHPDAEIHSFYTGDDDGAAVSAVCLLYLKRSGRRISTASADASSI